MGTYWPWEPTATLRSGLCRRGRLGGARRFGAHRGRRGAGAYCDGRPPTACYIVFFSHKILIVRTVEICIFKVIHTYVQYVSQFKYLNHIIAMSLDGKNVKSEIRKTFVPIIFMRRFSIKKILLCLLMLLLLLTLFTCFSGLRCRIVENKYIGKRQLTYFFHAVINVIKVIYWI